MEQTQPKIVQKLLLRTFFLLLAVAAVFLGIQLVLNWRTDPDRGVADTAGSVAAIEVLQNGQQAVIFDVNGKKIPSPDYEQGKTDRDIVWRPDGNRLFFISDRKEASFHLYRWNPASGAVEQKSTGTVNKFDPSFPVVSDPSNKEAVESAGNVALVTQGGGAIQELKIREATAQQILPPPRNSDQTSDEESGVRSGFETLYGRIGNAFRTARWFYNQRFIAAVIKRDEGEVLIIQEPKASDAMGQLPRIIVAGDKIDIDVDPKSGFLIYTVLNYQFVDPERVPEEAIKDGKVIKPFINGVFILDPTKTGAEASLPMAFTAELKQAFGPVAISPDGSSIATVIGSYDRTNFEPEALLIAPLQPGGMNQGNLVLRGRIYEVSWHPNGNTLVFIKSDGKERAIYRINRDGSNQTKVSDGGNYITPKFSPQVK